MIASNRYNINGTFPCVITPVVEVRAFPDFQQELKQHQSDIQALLLKHGALLFRGFPVEGAEQFAHFIETLALGSFVNYIGGDSPRNKVTQSVYTSTEAPPSFHIPLHQELSFIKHHPKHIYFFCETPAENGGATIISDARRVYQAIDQGVKNEFMTRQLKYTSRYYYRGKIMTYLNRLQRSHKSWIEVFETSHKHEVEEKCKANDFAWHWYPNDWLEIQQTRPATTKHPVTQEEIWFNQAHLYDFNPRLLGVKNYIAAKLFYIRRSTRLHEIAYADHAPIPRKYIYHILDVLNDHTVSFPWQKGDVLVLDNMLAMHGRAPFSGKRRIFTALTS